MTFEPTCKTPLETFEWDSFWLEHTENTTAPRVLYIGDSISKGTYPLANKLAGGRLLFDNFATSKGLDNPYYRSSILAAAEQQGHRELVFFNNGLHGWHLDDETEFLPLLRDTMLFLQQSFAGTPVVMLPTTYIEREGIAARAKRRTDLARALAKEMSFPLLDLYEVTYQNRHLLRDGVHFHTEGYQNIASFLVENAMKILEM